jgi:hypothetical protein
MDNRTDVRRRRDLHNISIDFAAASARRCGLTHLYSGRVRQLSHRHHGPCQLRRDAERLAGSLRG